MKKRTYILHIKTPRGVKRSDSANKRRFLNHTRRIIWKIKGLEVYVKVFYGKQEDYRGKLIKFYNDGNYTDKQEFYKALRAFCE